MVAAVKVAAGPGHTQTKGGHPPTGTCAGRPRAINPGGDWIWKAFSQERRFSSSRG
jgi:hypothetical protein